MKILKIEPGAEPVTMELSDSLEAMQELVGGLIQVVYPFADQAALVCNDEGKLMGLPFNRALQDENDRIYDVICGTFFICGVPEDGDSFTDLTPDQLDYYTHYFRYPEYLLKTPDGLAVLKL